MNLKPTANPNIQSFRLESNFKKPTVETIKVPEVKKNTNNKNCEPEIRLCPKFNLPECAQPAKRLPSCRAEFPVVCQKLQAPFKAFSDCLDEELAEKLSECPLEHEKKRALQPDYVRTLDNTKLIKPIQPRVGKLDLTAEDDCVRRRLCLEKCGVTKSCGSFGQSQRPLRAKDIVKIRDDIVKQAEEEKKFYYSQTAKNCKRKFCTCAFNPLTIQKRGLCNCFNNVLIQKKSYHLLCKTQERNLEEELDERKNTHRSKEYEDVNRSKLGSSQSRVDNFQKWHRLNKLNGHSTLTRRHYSCFDLSRETQRMYSSLVSNTVSANAIDDEITCRHISTSSSECSKRKTIDPRKIKLSKSFTKATTVKQSSSTSCFQGVNFVPECDYRQETLLKPNLPNYAERLICEPYPNIGVIDYNLGREYMRHKYGLVNEGVTQDCCTFGTSIRCEDVLFKKVNDQDEDPCGFKESSEQQEVDACGMKIKSPKNLVDDAPKIEDICRGTKTDTLHTSQEEVCHDTKKNVLGADQQEVCQDTKRQSYRLDQNEVCQDTTKQTCRLDKIDVCQESKKQSVGSDIKEVCQDTNKSSLHTDPEDVCQNFKKHSLNMKRSLPNISFPTKVLNCEEDKQKNQRFVYKACKSQVLKRSASSCDEHLKELHAAHAEDQIASLGRSICESLKPIKKADSMWQKFVNYFKARPDCPPPDEWKKKALKARAEKAAKAAGMVLCDPKDLERLKNPKKLDLPKVITPCGRKKRARLDDVCPSQKKPLNCFQRRNFTTTTLPITKTYCDPLYIGQFLNKIIITVPLDNNHVNLIGSCRFPKILGCVCNFPLANGNAEFLKHSSNKVVSKRFYSKYDEKKQFKDVAKAKNDKEKLSNRNVQGFQDNNSEDEQDLDDTANENTSMERHCEGETDNEGLLGESEGSKKYPPRRKNLVDIIFPEDLNENAEYHQAKALAAFQELFNKYDSYSEINFEELGKYR